jgi:hypothetical protein
MVHEKVILSIDKMFKSIDFLDSYKGSTMCTYRLTCQMFQQFSRHIIFLHVIVRNDAGALIIKLKWVYLLGFEMRVNM